MGQVGIKITEAALVRPVLIVSLVIVLFASALSKAQDTDRDTPQSTSDDPQQSVVKPRKVVKTPPDPTIENNIDAVEADESEEATGTKHWNEFDAKYITGRVGLGFLYETAAYDQDEQSKEQFPLEFGYKVRDFRFLFSGGFPTLKRSVTYSVGVMYDAPNGSWLIRQTGIMVALSETWGHLFIGRTKEGFSLNKVMTGYDGWTMERATMNDATVPLLADGIKWMGYLPKHGFMWNVGYYNDVFSKGQSFSSFSSQEVARLAWLPVRSVSETHSLVHLGVNLHYGKPTENQLQARSRPEAFPAPYFVDTGKFPAKAAFMAGYEAYYRRRNWLFGSEYWFEKVSSPSTHNPVFNGGDIVAAWTITGETRTYNTVGGFFRAVLPERPVFNGGPGAWELVSRYSYINLDSGTLQGGRFGRFTEQLNWYLSRYVRLEFAYGFGRLDRFDLKGDTQFFQSRLQLQF